MFILGGLSGAALRPLLSPVKTYGAIVSPAQDGCDLVWSSATYYIGSSGPAFGDGGRELACMEETQIAPNVRLTCKCEPRAPSP